MAKASGKGKPVVVVSAPPYDTLEAGHIRGYGEYEIDIEEILREALPRFFARIEPSPLTPEAVRSLPLRAKGAYVLFLDGTPVYAGKTDTRHGFRDRLDRHAFTVQGRHGLDPSRMAFKAVRIMVFSAFDVEAILIGEMRRLDTDHLAWNDSGFGSNDPGRKRDEQEPADFDRDFPIDLDIPAQVPSTADTAFTALTIAKNKAPYLIRFPTRHDDLRVAALNVSGPEMTIRSLLDAVLTVLSEHWQATVLHGRVILYRERKAYEHALEIMRGRL